MKDKVDLTKYFNFKIVGYTKPIMQDLKPYYTKVMNGIKNLKGYVYLISPKDFLKNSYATSDVSKEEIRTTLDIDNLKPKFALPYIDTIGKKGLGRGRVLLCDKKGLKEIPVLIAGKDKAQIEKWLKDKKLGVKAYG